MINIFTSQVHIQMSFPLDRNPSEERFWISQNDITWILHVVSLDNAGEIQDG
jgi:hypothetical protein